MEDIYLTTQQICHLFSITKQGLSKWVEKGFPKADRNKYLLQLCFEWWKNYYVGDINADTTIAREQLRYQKARAEREELTVKKLKEELVPKDSSLQWLLIMATEAKTALRGLPRRMSRSLAAINDPKQIEVDLTKEIRQILNSLAANRGVLRAKRKPVNAKQPLS